MISVELRGALKLSEQLRLLALTPADRRRILSRAGQAIARKLRTAIRRQVRAAPAGTFASREEQTAKARDFAKLVRVKASADQVVIFDRGIEGERRRQGDNATLKQARRLRELGFRLPAAYITRNFSQGLAGMLIREMETSKPGRRRSRKRGSLVLMAWRKNQDEILAAVDVAGIIRREMAA